MRVAALCGAADDSGRAALMLSRLNLAPLRYFRACAAGGPVARVSSLVVELYGQRLHQANAWLSEGLRPERCRGLYGAADGTGSASTPAVARHKAISEALERWAHDETYRGPDRALYGLDVDPTSTGFAAFPGWSAEPAREAAVAEARERACLLGWSMGLVRSRRRSIEWPGIDAVELESPWPGTCVILYRRTGAGLVTYGHAYAPSFVEACDRALIELGRNEAVLVSASQEQDPAWRQRAANVFERRCVFFSSVEGHARFQERIGAGAGRGWCPDLLIDRAVPGPWSAYATVWRVLYAPPVEEFLSEDNVFFW